MITTTQAMQAVLWRGAADPVFLAHLLAAPGEILRELEFRPAEIAHLTAAPLRSLADLAHRVEAWRRGEPLATPVRQLALAG